MAALWLFSVALAASAEAGDAVVVVQETRTPVVSKQRRSAQHVVVLKNVSAAPVHGLRVTVEFYDFFGKLLWASLPRRGPADSLPLCLRCRGVGPRPLTDCAG